MMIFDQTDVLKMAGFIAICSVMVHYTVKIISRAKVVKLQDVRDKTALQARNNISLPSMIRNREVKSPRKPTNDFWLYPDLPTATPEEYFYYFMSGLDWPCIQELKISKNEHTSHIWMTVVNSNHVVSVWFWANTDHEDYIVSLHKLFKLYEKDDYEFCIQEPVESIVARAKGVKEDNMVKYGYEWGRHV